MVWRILILLLLMSCGSSLEQEKPADQICFHDLFEDYNLSIGKWDVDTLKYSIQSDLLNSCIIQRVLSEACEHMDKPFIRDDENPDIVMLVDDIDGPGTVLGRSYFPPISEHSIYPVPITFDKADLNPNFDFYSVVLHEVLHSIGIRHSSLDKAVMAPYYKKTTSLHIDDILAIRTKYEVFEDFIYKGDAYIHMNGSDHSKVTRHFLHSEYAGSCQHNVFISKRLVETVQYLRDVYGPIKITSTFRDEDCNSSAGGAQQSTHQLGQAIDLKFLRAGSMNKFKAVIVNPKSPVYQRVTRYVKGIGLYDRHIHLDVGDRKRITTWSGISNFETDA